VKLIILSGMSGSGKTIALHTLEDMGYYCVDNLPVALLSALVEQMQNTPPRVVDLIAVAIDARSGSENLQRFPTIISALKEQGIDATVVFLTSQVDTLLTRFSETRRKHPLTRKGLPLVEAIHIEQSLLGPVRDVAEVIIDTSKLTVHELRAIIKQRIETDNPETLTLLFQSFGFKHGLPNDTDFIFDVRCLPNPHWDVAIRDLTGRDQPVIDFFKKYDSVQKMQDSIATFLQQWIPVFEEENRSYLTVSIGCTGGHHRSVYLAENIANNFDTHESKHTISVRHRDLN